MISVIIPAHNEQPYLNTTIDNLIRSAHIVPEIICVDNGGNGDIDPRAKVIKPSRNVGERVAMNEAAARATGQFLFRIDAHCDFSPSGWDVMLAEVTGERDLTMAVLTALRMPWDQAPQKEKDEWLAAKRCAELWNDPQRSWKELSDAERRQWKTQNRTREDWHDWERLKGHWYGLTRLVTSQQGNDPIGIEAKWQGANKDHNQYHGVHPTMAATGCGMMIRKSFYDEIGGADETLPPMGAIGEEFALKAWASGGRCQTHMDVMVGHVFSTGGYHTVSVKIAQQILWERYGHLYEEICAKFPTFDLPIRLIRTDQQKPLRTVIVERCDNSDTKDDATGKLLRRKVETFRYIWLSNEHPGEESLTDQEIEAKYAPVATAKVKEQILYFTDQGEPVPQENQLVGA